MESSKTRLLLCAIAVVALPWLARHASAQNAAVIITANSDGREAVVNITVNANFKGARGTHTFHKRIAKKRGETADESITKSGFVYNVGLSWVGTNTIRAEATVRSKYGTVRATGTTELQDGLPSPSLPYTFDSKHYARSSRFGRFGESPEADCVPPPAN